MSDETRRYQLIERLGQGGFGVVYRARMLAAHGFEKDVAVKLLHPDVSPASVARFRDEARILGLLSDRAIVSVHAPVQLDGRWALVMEFVDGADLATLLGGGVPARVAVQVVGEVARALDVAHHTRGPDGSPLGLLHRDLKPANLRITPAGQVKILDFGVARAAFEGREVQTTQHIGGTPAYMAPERLQGQELPEGDVYSLGVVLHELVTGARPAGMAVEPTFEDARAAEVVDEVLALARAMRSPDPLSRPSAREVEERCEALAGGLDGPTLRRWAEERVKSAVGTGEAVGAELSETPSAGRPTATRSRPWPWLVAAAVAVVAVGWWTRPAPSSEAAPVAAAPVEEPPPAPVPRTLAEDLRQPLLHFVMEDSAAAAERTGLRDPDHWDPALAAGVEARLVGLAREAATWRRLDQVVDTYASVVAQARDAGLPEVVAGIPWVESRYMPEQQSNMCAKGLWQFMPVTAVTADPPLAVADCRTTDSDAIVQPTDEIDGRPAFLDADGVCRIPRRLGCAVDERTDARKSTATALAMLDDAWSDPQVRASGLGVPLMLASHYTGQGGLRRTLRAFEAEHGEEALPRLFSEHPGMCMAHEPCQGRQPHLEYAASVLAAHFAAVCYYGANYADRDAFAPYARYADLYCSHLAVPDRTEVAVP